MATAKCVSTAAVSQLNAARLILQIKVKAWVKYCQYKISSPHTQQQVLEGSVPFHDADASLFALLATGSLPCGQTADLTVYMLI